MKGETVLSYGRERIAPEPGKQPWLSSYPEGIAWDAPVERITLSALLDRSVGKFGSRTVIEFYGRRVSYRNLADLADRTATAFRRMGLGRGSTLAIYLPNTPYHPIALFAAARLGVRVAHLSPLDAVRELAFKLRDCGARFMVASGAARTGRVIAMEWPRPGAPLSYLNLYR